MWPELKEISAVRYVDSCRCGSELCQDRNSAWPERWRADTSGCVPIRRVDQFSPSVGDTELCFRTKHTKSNWSGRLKPEVLHCAEVTATHDTLVHIGHCKMRPTFKWLFHWKAPRMLHPGMSQPVSGDGILISWGNLQHAVWPQRASLRNPAHWSFCQILCTLY